MTIGPPCPVCGYIHRPETSTRAVGRFTEANADMCDYYATKETDQ